MAVFVLACRGLGYCSKQQQTVTIMILIPLNCGFQLPLCGYVYVWAGIQAVFWFHTSTMWSIAMYRQTKPVICIVNICAFIFV